MSDLRDITARWRGCTGCALRRTCKQVVVGEPWSNGDVSEAHVLLVVGDAPGSHEERDGRPFVGEAGSVLRDEILAAADVRLAYLTNSVGCRPPGNREPEARELEVCAARVAELAEAIRPAGVLLVGRTAERTFASAPWLAGVPVVDIVHPSILLHRGHPNDGTRKTIAAQVAKVRRLISRADSPRKGRTKGEPASAPPPAPTGPCECSPVPAGVWRHTSGATEPFEVCAACASLRKTPARSAG